MEAFYFRHDLNFKKQSEFLKLLKNWGFNINEHNKIITGIDSLVNNHKEFEKKRFEIEITLMNLATAPRPQPAVRPRGGVNPSQELG